MDRRGDQRQDPRRAAALTTGFAMGLAVGLAMGLVLLGCQPGPGEIVLEARRGRVVDATSGQAVEGADVFQVYWGRGIAGEPRPAYALRWAASDARGEFAFDRSLSDDPRAWGLRTDPPEYGYYHRDYGLVRTGVAAKSEALLRGQRLDEAGRRAASMSLCGARPADAVIAAVASRHCGRAP